MSVQPATVPFGKKAAFKTREIIKLIIFAVLFVVSGTLIMEVEFLSNQVAQLQVNQISPQDVAAPSSISYESQISTERAREQAARLVSSVYSRPDPNVAREQQVVASQVFAYLDAVRVDPHLAVAQKLDFIQAINPVSFTLEEAAAILNLDEALWADAKQEVDAILNEVMRSEIKETDLPGVRFRLGLRVSPDVPDQEAQVILSIVEELTRPNSFIDEARTEEKRQEARIAAPPAIVSFEKNEVVIRAGERIDELDIEALAQLGLHESTTSWQNYLSTFLWLSLLVFCTSLYLVRYNYHILKSTHKVGVLFVISLIFVLVIRVMVPNQELLPYAVPIAALTMIIAGTLDPQLAMIVTLMMGLIQGYIAGNVFEFTVYVSITGLIVSLSVKQMAQVNTILWAGLYAAISNVFIILLFRVFEFDFSLISTNTLLTVLAQAGNGILSGVVSAGLAVIAFLIIGNWTDVITHIQLIELSRPTQPLLEELLRRAPGTYHHSLLVSNLAEQAATRIGANVVLCRVGAYYHDVGKMIRPYFFTENQTPGVSLHDNLDPETSAQILISHVTDGLALAKKHNLPPVLRSFIAEHHGKEVTGYFYHKALEEAGGDETQVDKTRYTYPGPTPQSKETAILMLADASEATVRSVQPGSAEEIDKIVRKTISDRMKSGQFDECGLTMGDFEQIRIAFNDVLQGVTHQRIRYPDQIREEAKLETGPLPALPLAVQRTQIAPSDSGDVATRSRIPLPRD
jgi:hypothetical protein